MCECIYKGCESDGVSAECVVYSVHCKMCVYVCVRRGSRQHSWLHMRTQSNSHRVNPFKHWATPKQTHIPTHTHTHTHTLNSHPLNVPSLTAPSHSSSLAAKRVALRHFKRTQCTCVHSNTNTHTHTHLQEPSVFPSRLDPTRPVDRPLPARRSQTMNTSKCARSESRRHT